MTSHKTGLGSRFREWVIVNGTQVKKFPTAVFCNMLVKKLISFCGFTCKELPDLACYLVFKVQILMVTPNVQMSNTTLCV